MHISTVIDGMAAKSVYNIFFTIKHGSSEIQSKSCSRIIIFHIRT